MQYFRHCKQVEMKQRISARKYETPRKIIGTINNLYYKGIKVFLSASRIISDCNRADASEIPLLI